MDFGARAPRCIPDQQQILMTGYPLRLREHPELAEGFARVFTKPLDLKELRQTVDSLLDPATETTPPLVVLAEAEDRPAIQTRTVRPAAPLTRSGTRRLLGGAMPVVVLALLAVGAFATLHYGGLEAFQNWLHPKPAAPETADKPPQATLAPGNAYAIILPKEVALKLGIQTATAERATATRPLQFDGYLGYDPNQTVTLNTLFTGQIEKLIDYPDPVASRYGETVVRPVQFKDPVKQGQVLALLYSKDLGEKKSELVSAWSQYNLDQQYTEQFDRLFKLGLTSEANVLQYRAAAQQDLNAVDRARRTLAVWHVSEEDMHALQLEAERLLKMSPTDRAQFGDQQKVATWAQVEIKAPFDGIVVEKNVAPGLIVDPTKDLYKIAKPDRMIVYAHAYEDSLPGLLQPQARGTPVEGARHRRSEPGTTGRNHQHDRLGRSESAHRPFDGHGSQSARCARRAAPDRWPVRHCDDPASRGAERAGDSDRRADRREWRQHRPHSARPGGASLRGASRAGGPPHQGHRHRALGRSVHHGAAGRVAARGRAREPGAVALFGGQIEPGQLVVTNGSLLLLSELMDLRSKEKEKE